MKNILCEVELQQIIDDEYGDGLTIYGYDDDDEDLTDVQEIEHD